MKTYMCSLCNYDTDRFTDLARHNKTMKHIQKENESKTKNINVTIKSPQSHPKVTINKCENCEKIFSYKQGLSRHRKTCKTDNAAEVAKLKAQIIELENKNLKEQNEYLKKDNIVLQNIAQSATDTSKTSCSALNFVVNNYKNTPCIEKFNDYKLLKHGNEDHSISVIVIHKYNRNELCSFIGDILVTKYKKPNPEEQPVWNSDSERLAYLIRELTKDNTERWFTDKGGIKLSSYIVKPILDHIKDELEVYTKVSNDDLISNENLSIDEQADLRKQIMSGHKVINIIKNGILDKEIIKYISHYFHLDRKTEIKLIEH